MHYLATVLALLGGTSAAFADCCVVGGPELFINIPGYNRKVKPNKISKFVSRAPDTFTLPEPGTEEDPTIGGATLFFGDTGAAAGDLTLTLESTGWQGLGKPPGAKGYKFKGKNVGSPCKTVVIKSKVVKAVCKGDAITIAPPYGGLSTVELGIPAGDTPVIKYCAAFGGEEKKNDAKVMLRLRAPAPTCP